MVEISISKFLSGGKKYAGFWRRLIAGMIDLVILIIITAISVAYLGLGEGFRMLLMLIRRQDLVYDDGTLATGILPMPVASFLLVTIVIIPWLYYAILESSKNQATLGKMAARIIVTDLHNQRLTFTRATLRHFSKFFSLCFFLTGFVCILYTRYQQGFHDVIGACLVWYQKETMDL